MLKRTILAGLVSLFLTASLVACGDSPTATPTPTPTPLPTATPLPTPTLAPSPTAISLPSQGTPSTPPIVPAPPNATPVTIDTTALGSLLQSLGVPASGTNPLQINIYASNDDPDTLAASYSAALKTAGFQPFSVLFGGTALLTKQGQQYIGLLTMGDTQAIVALEPYSDDLVKQIASAGIPADVIQSVTSQIAGKKTVVVTVSGTGILQAFVSSFLGGSSSSATATPAPTTK
jgi:hypothetical protein